VRVSRLFTGAAASARSSAAAADCRPLAVASARVAGSRTRSGAVACAVPAGAEAEASSAGSGAGSGVASGRVRVTNARSESGDATTVPVPTWPCVTVAGCCSSSVSSAAASESGLSCGAACGSVGRDASGSAEDAAGVPESASSDTAIATEGSKAAGADGGVARLAVVVASVDGEAAVVSEGCGAGVVSGRLSGCSLKAITATGLITGFTETRVSSGGGRKVSRGGVLLVNDHKAIKDIVDGTSNTIALGEQSGVLIDTSGNEQHWNPSTRFGIALGTVGTSQTQNSVYNVATVRYTINNKDNNGAGWDTSSYGVNSGNSGAGAPNAPLNSEHPGGTMVLLTDGAVRFLNEGTALETLAQLATRDDGKAISGL
jgi:hypothetical protein